MKICVSGLINIETTIPVSGFPVEYNGIVYLKNQIVSNPSGVGWNVSKALSVLGDEVSFISFLGRDAASAIILDELKSFGISADNIYRTLESTPVSTILYDPSGRRQIFTDRKNILDQNIDPAGVIGALKSCDLAVLCNIGFNRDLIKEARAQGVRTATDVHLLNNADDDYNRDFMANADILFLSDERLPREPGDFIRELHDRYHNRVIVIGMGSKGALLLDAEGDGLCFVPSYTDVQVKNTVGAGDSLFSSFLHFYSKGLSPKASLERAVIFAAKKIETSGAAQGFLTEEEIERIYQAKKS